MIRRLALIVALAAVGMGLAACGRKAAPRSPDDAFYPQIYPARPKGEITGVPTNTDGLPQQTSPDALFRPQSDPSYPQAQKSTGTQ